MTRQEFIDDINDVHDLVSFCYEHGLEEEVEHIYSEEHRDDCINEELYDAARECDWQDLRDILADIPMGYDYYTRGDGYLEWYGYDEGYNFEDDKQAVLDSIDNWYDNIFDEEDDDEDIEDAVIQDDEPEEETDFEEFFNECREEHIRFISRKEEEDEEEDNNLFFF